MSDDNNSPTDTASGARPRRASFTSTTFTSLFSRGNSISGPASGVTPQPAPVTTPTTPGRRMSISTLGLSGSSPLQTSGLGFPGGRRGSASTAGSDSIDENAVDDDDGPAARSVPTTPFTRRMSFGAQALLNARGNGSSSTGRTPSYTPSSSPLSRADQKAGRARKTSSTQASTQSKPRNTSDHSSTRSAEGLNWSEQFRSRAESAVQRPSFGTSPTSMIPRSPTAPAHERTKSFGEMPSPPTASIPSAPPVRQESALRRKPDAVGERILRGDFYMD